MTASSRRTREHYRRHLPHQIPQGFPIFVTWNLKGSLPRETRLELEQERERLERQPPLDDESREERLRRLESLLFVKRDAILNSASTGPLWLNDPAAAQIVVDRILFGAVRQPVECPGVESVNLKPDVRYELYAYCVMSNHVHALLKPFWEWKDVMQGIKGSTAFQINKLQDARGRVFWQDESYDHWCRSEQEILRTIEYIELNPVSAGLCAKPEEWPWSSARWRPTWKLGDAFRFEFLPIEERQRLVALWAIK
jgi:REP-associated tyrosine transposase